MFLYPVSVEAFFPAKACIRKVNLLFLYWESSALKFKLRDRLAGFDQVFRSQEIVVRNCWSSRQFTSLSGASE